MIRLDLTEIIGHAGDKVADDYTLSPVSYTLIVHMLTLLSDNQWLFDSAGEAERDATDQALDEMLP